MSEHKWLLKENVENAPTDGGVIWSPALKRGFIADWLEMRKLCQRIWAMDTPAEHTSTWWAIKAMLKETADD